MINTINTFGHKVSAMADSVLHTRNAKYARLRVLATGTLLGGIFLISTTNLAMANSLSTYSSAIANNTSPILNIVTYASYLGGSIMAALGIVDLKKHVENPSQNPLKNGLAKLGFGGILLALPTITGVMQETMQGQGTEAQYQPFSNNNGITIN